MSERENKRLFLSFVAGVFCMFIGSLIIDFFVNYATTRRAIEIEKAQYNSKTGKIEWLDKDLRYILEGKK